jgi:branched-chain amino acid aminotransferase
MPAGTKVCGNYVNSFLAAREAEEKGFDEALLLDNNGFVCEASAENVFLVKASKLFTPPLSEGILAGVTRDSIMEIARARGIPVREKRLRLRDLREGSELFLTGTAAGVVPVNKLGEKTFDAPGEVTAKLQNVFSRVVRGEEKNFWKWLDFVA